MAVIEQLTVWDALAFVGVCAAQWAFRRFQIWRERRIWRAEQVKRGGV